MTKELFVKTMEDIKKESARLDKFDDAIALVCDGHPVVTAGEGYLNALLTVLNAIFGEENEPYPTIEWWLFEDVEKKIWEIDKATGRDVEYDVSTPEALYDYLTKNKNPINQ